MKDTGKNRIIDCVSPNDLFFCGNAFQFTNNLNYKLLKQFPGKSHCQLIKLQYVEEIFISIGVKFNAHIQNI